jgi:hypothetical protein
MDCMLAEMCRLVSQRVCVLHKTVSCEGCNQANSTPEDCFYCCLRFTC